MRYCEKCGSALSDDSRFCENCGAAVSPAEPGLDEQNTIFSPRKEPGRPSSDNYYENPRREEPQGGVSGPRAGASGGRAPQGGVSGPRAGASGGRAPQGGAPGPRAGASGGRVPQGGAPGPRAGASGGRVPQGGAPGPRPILTNGRQPYRPGEEAERREQERRNRYQQESLGGDWQQSWDREPEEDDEDESRFTPLQYVLLGLAGVLLIAALTFGIFWAIGRVKDGDSRDRTQEQGLEQTEETSKKEKQTDTITILDGGAAQTEAAQPVTEAATEKQTEAATEPVTEAPTYMVLNYSEFTVTIPADWKGKYGVTQSANEYIFYQQSSKQKGYNGTLFTISRYTDTSYRDLPNFKELGVGNGAAFIFRLPSDVQYAAEDPAVQQEYQAMSADLEQIRNNIRILATGSGPKETEAVEILDLQQNQQNTQQQADTQNSGEYILQGSSERLLTSEDVAGMSYDDLQMAINEIYARHGRKFSSESIQSYFESKSWYQGTVEPDAFSDSVFNQVEAENIQFLLGKMGIQ